MPNNINLSLVNINDTNFEVVFDTENTFESYQVIRESAFAISKPESADKDKLNLLEYNEAQKFYFVHVQGKPADSGPKVSLLPRLMLRTNTGTVIVIDEGGSIISDLVSATIGSLIPKTCTVNTSGCVTVDITETIEDAAESFFFVYNISATQKAIQRFPIVDGYRRIGLKLYNNATNHSSTTPANSSGTIDIDIYPTSSLDRHQYLKDLYFFNKIVTGPYPYTSAPISVPLS